MSRPRPPYLIKRHSRHGSVSWYYWKRPGPQIRIRGDYGSPEFWANYEAARVTPVALAPEKPREKVGTLAWLIAEYRASPDWLQELSEATREARDNIFHPISEKWGDLPVEKLRRVDIKATLDAKAATPFAAKNFLSTMRGLFRWAVAADKASSDPTAGLKPPAPGESEGFHQWTEEEVDQFERHWPIGSRERLAMSIMLYTGLRRGDAAVLGRQHVRNGEIQIYTEKGRRQKPPVMVTLPVLPPLREALAATKTGDLTFVGQLRNGAPMTKESFGNWFGEAAKAAGVAGNCHGLRKVAATRCAEAGATIHQLNAIFGWSGTAMAMHYTKLAERKKLSREAAGMLMTPARAGGADGE